MSPRKKNSQTEPETPEQNVDQSDQTVSELQSTHILTTGLEDYGRWKSIYDKHKRDPNEKPFRRGRIWC